jgi:hypothetical protein
MTSTTLHSSTIRPEAGFLVTVHPEPCLILSRAQIRALLCSSKSKFIPAWTLTLLVLDKKNGLRIAAHAEADKASVVEQHR